MSSSNKITIKGVEYCSIKEAALALGLHYGNLVRRLRSGWSIDQCLGAEEPPRRTAPNRVEIKTSSGKFLSIRHASAEFGLLESTI